MSVVASSYSAVLATPIGNVGLSIDKNALARLTFLPAHVLGISLSTIRHPDNTVINTISNWLEYYFEQPNNNPYELKSLPIQCEGTDFQRSVWKLLMKIPPGVTLTYGDLARALKTSPRAVGNACRVNPIPIIVPCHRVVAQTHLGGYSGQIAGDLLNIKKFLLDHELKYKS